jgi:hypothetical protein
MLFRIQNIKEPTAMLTKLSWRVKAALSLILFVVLSAVSLLLLDIYNFSVGSRTGIISKLSTKGVACWTNEGQLALPNFTRGTVQAGGAIENTFHFSVPDSEVWKKLRDIPPGNPVNVQYRQKLFPLALALPFLCVRRTEFEVIGAEPAPNFAPVQPQRR